MEIVGTPLEAVVVAFLGRMQERGFVIAVWQDGELVPASWTDADFVRFTEHAPPATRTDGFSIDDHVQILGTVVSTPQAFAIGKTGVIRRMLFDDTKAHVEFDDTAFSEFRGVVIGVEHLTRTASD